MARINKQHGIGRAIAKSIKPISRPAPITEDEVDLVIGRRREATEPSKSFEQYLAERG